MVWYILVADINQSGIPSPLYFVTGWFCFQPAPFRQLDVAPFAATAGGSSPAEAEPESRVCCAWLVSYMIYYDPAVQHLGAWFSANSSRRTEYTADGPKPGLSPALAYYQVCRYTLHSPPQRTADVC